MPTCVKCGAKGGFLDVLTTDLVGPHFCQKCQAIAADDARKLQDAQKKQAQLIRQAAAKVIVTTTPKIDGFYATDYLGIESVEYVIGTGIFSEVTSDIADFFGARSSAFEVKLQTAKKHAFSALKIRAAEKGANAVIGVDMDYSEFSGNRVALIVNGTLVKLAPIQPRQVAKRFDPDL